MNSYVTLHGDQRTFRRLSPSNMQSKCEVPNVEYTDQDITESKNHSCATFIFSISSLSICFKSPFFQYTCRVEVPLKRIGFHGSESPQPQLLLYFSQQREVRDFAGRHITGDF